MTILTRRWRQVADEEFRSIGLTDAMWRPLLNLQVLGEGICQKDLAASIGIEGPSLVRILDSLEENGLIRRLEDKKDRRAKRIALTNQGRATVERIRKILNPMVNRFLRKVEAEDYAHLERMVLLMESNLMEMQEAKS